MVEHASLQPAAVKERPQRPTVLIVDSPENLKNIETDLHTEMFTALTCQNWEKAHDIMASYKTDILVFDPSISPVSLSEVEATKKPFIITSRTKPEDRMQATIHALDSGADFFLSKPVDHFVLATYIRASLRRPIRKVKTEEINLLDAKIDSKTIKRGEKSARLPGREKDVLLFLLKEKGVVMSNEDIFKNILVGEIDQKNIDKCFNVLYVLKIVHRLRNILKSIDLPPELIETVKEERGFRLNLEARKTPVES